MESLDKDFISNTLPFFKEDYAAVQGKIDASNREYNLLSRLLALEGDLFSFPFMVFRGFLNKKTPLGGTGFIIKKDILIKVGKFTNSLIDDFELSFRLYKNKHKIAFAPLSIVYDEKPPILDVMIRQRSRWVKGHIDLLKHRVAEPSDLLGMIYWLSPVFLHGPDIYFNCIICRDILSRLWILSICVCPYTIFNMAYFSYWYEYIIFYTIKIQ